MAISHAQKAGIILLASARDEGFTIYTGQTNRIPQLRERAVILKAGAEDEGDTQSA